MLLSPLSHSYDQPWILVDGLDLDSDVERIIQRNLDLAINPNLVILARLYKQPDSPGLVMAKTFGLETYEHLYHLAELSSQCIRVMSLYADYFYSHNPHMVGKVQAVGLPPYAVFPFIPPENASEIRLINLPPFSCCVFDQTKNGEFKLGVRTFKNRVGIVDRFGAYWCLATPSRYHGPSPADIRYEHPERELCLVSNGFSYVEWDIAIPNSRSDWENLRQFRLATSDIRACILAFSLLVGPSRHARFPHINCVPLLDEKGRLLSWVDTNALRVDRMRRPYNQESF
ncbi:MAG: hypothetical protein NZO16_04255 [Deltaproteobacteria bacterium]|nr:hypothetical protein [Deltaproteobacteria bacterium]